MSLVNSSKIIHVLGVANYMYKKAKALGWNQSRCNEMWALGLIHDCEHLINQLDPSIKLENGGQVLNEASFKYSFEIANVWRKVDNDKVTDELILLDEADNNVDNNGEVISFTLRMEQHRNKHGADSAMYKRSSEYAKWYLSNYGDDYLNKKYLNK